MYDAAIGRFPTIDPIADQFPHVSPYNYAENEPIANIDLHGLQKAHYSIIEKGIFHVANYLRGRKGEAEYIAENTIRSYRVATTKAFVDLTTANLGFPEGGQHGPKGNAFRHTLGTAIFTERWGEEEATKIADAHEDNHSNVLSDMATNVSELNSTGKTNVGNDPYLADSFVDQLNNEVGKEIGKNNTDGSARTMANLVLDAMAAGKVFEMKKDGNGDFIVKPLQIDSGAIDKMKKDLDSFKDFLQN